MLLKKKINNNFVLAEDNSGKEIIASGKGLGFKKMPCVLDDLSEVKCTFYNVDQTYSEMLASIPDDVINITSILMKEINRSIDDMLNPNLFFILADHISFCIEREVRGIHITLPLRYDILNLYPKEVEIGKKALGLIQEMNGTQLDEVEAFGIAMNIVNARTGVRDNGQHINKEENIIKDIVCIVEESFGQKINRNDFNYSRFAMHVHYLISRLKKKEEILSVNQNMVKDIRKEYPEMWEGCEKISRYLDSENGFECNAEEKFYLLLHINRMLSRD